MAEQPALNRIHVVGYSANDRDFPILNLVADPRVAGYRIPEDLSACPDKRYPNHVFTGAQPIAGDQRVRHTWEILPSPWVPFTRYDDDLGPVQGRRRSVKNGGQVAIREADKQVTYEAREGSAIVYTELEETWSIATDEDGNSLFPIRDRDFYDASRGPVQERRQLFVPTGEEEGSLENVNGVITQTSYEPYNEFLSVKIVQTYKVNGPQLIGNATNDVGQLVTVTAQRKAADGYIAPQPTATRTVESNREDAETLVERIVDAPEVFSAKTFAKEANDPAPAKFRVAVPTTTSEENLAGEAQEPTLGDGDISKSEQQISKFVKRIRSTFRNLLSLPKSLGQVATNNDGQLVLINETLQLGDTDIKPSATTTVESEALGDGTYVVRTSSISKVFDAKIYRKTREDLTPQKFKAAQEDTTFEETIAGKAESPTLDAGEFVKSEQQVTEFVKRVSKTSRDISSAVRLEESIITPQGQVAKRTLQLKKVDPSNPPVLQPDAKTIDGSIEALGDGRVVVSETKVDNVFAGSIFSIERPDPVPQKFRVNIPTKTTQFTVAGTAQQPTLLLTSEISKSEQQVTNFLKRINIITRDPATNPTTLKGLQFTSEMGGGMAKVEEEFPFSQTDFDSVDFGTIADEVEDLGNGQRVRRTVKLTPKSSTIDFGDGEVPISAQTLPLLRGQEYDDALDIVIPFQQVVAPPQNKDLSEGPRRRVTPRDVAHSTVIKYDIEDVQEALDNYYIELPEMVQISLPDKLVSVSCPVESSGSKAEAPSFSGDTYSYNFSSTYSKRGKVIYDIEEGFRGNIPATRAVFFLPNNNCSPTEVLRVVRANNNDQVSFFPNARPQASELIVFGESRSEEESKSVSFDSAATANSTSGSFTIDTTIIPPTIHGRLIIGDDVDSGSGIAGSRIRPNVLEATQPYAIFPTGKFIYQINSSGYRFGYVRVEAVIVDITKEYV